MDYKVVEIFNSIDGEGIRTGQPVSFIRLAGCNLRCTYCDTLYALFNEETPCEFKIMSDDEIIKKLKYKRVTLTGGEPLIAYGVYELLLKLSENGFYVNIETNGACDILPFKDIKNMFYTIDYKLPSSGMCEKMIWNNYLNLRDNDVIKFVVGTDEDFYHMVDVVKKLQKHYKIMPNIFVGAVYGKFELRKLTELVLDTPELSDARIQVQLHKIIWEPDKKGV